MLGQDVVAAAEQAGHDVVGLARGDLDVTDLDAVRRCRRSTPRRPWSINCAAWTDVDGAEDARGRGDRGQRHRRRHRRGRRRERRRARHPGLDGLRLRGRRDSEPYVESDEVGPVGAYGRSKLAGEVAVREHAPRHAIVRTAWLFGRGGKNFVDTMRRLAEERDEVTVVDDQVGCPTYTGHLAVALVEIAERGLTGTLHLAGGGQLHLARPRRGDLRGHGRAGHAPPGHAAPTSTARPRALAFSVLMSERDDTPRPARVARRPASAPVMKLLVCGGAGFIGSHFARIRATEHGDDVVVLDKLTYAGRRENLADFDHEFVLGDIEDAAAVARARSPASTPSSTSPPRRTSTARSPSPTPSCGRTRSERTRCSRRHARPGVRYVQVSTDEVYGSIDEGTFTEESPLAPSSPYSATKAGADLLVLSYFHTYGMETVIVRGSNNYGPYQYPEKLIPLMVLNALHGDSLPVYGDGQQVRNWIHATDFARAIGHVLEHGVPGEVYNAGGPDECPNLDVVNRIIAATGASTDLIEYVADRPGHDVRYSLSSREGARPRLGAARVVRAGTRRHRRLVPRQRGLVGADPLGRLPRLLRAPVRPRAQLAAADERAGEAGRAAVALERQLRAVVDVDLDTALPRAGRAVRGHRRP